jgi:tRNA1Val (adenine37-N6)-methyltransferase
MCSKGGQPDLKFLDPLVVYNQDGSYTDEIYEIYQSENIDVFKREEVL